MLLVLIVGNFDIRNMFVNASPELVEILTFGRGVATGSAILVGAATVLGLIGAGLELLPRLVRNAIFSGLAWVAGIGMLSELITQILRNLFGNNAGESALRRQCAQADGRRHHLRHHRSALSGNNAPPQRRDNALSCDELAQPEYRTRRSAQVC